MDLVPVPKRERIEPTEDWEQLRLLVGSSAQETYELLRPIVLFGVPPAERAQQTGLAERTVRRKADRFDAEGMASLFASEAPGSDDHRLLPPPLRQAILALKAEYPVFRAHEIAGILSRREGRPLGHHTVQRVLSEGPLPERTTRRFPPYREMADPAERRLAIVRLFFEGWNIKSIAGYLETTRTRVYETLRRWVEEGVRGMADQSRAPKQPARRADLRAMAAIRRLQANPELGEFRVHAALKQLGIELSPRTCGRILAQHRALYDLAGPAAGEPHDSKAMPFQANHRHQYWSVDVRYLDTPAFKGGQVYVISVLENYSRALLATMLSRRQDLTAYLIVLRAAMRRHGAPETLVSDSGGIFKAKHAQAIYSALGIFHHPIERGKPWQNYIETHFNILRRMADSHFAKAATWEELQAILQRFFDDYNEQEHFAHRERPGGRRSPKAVLTWVQGAWCDDRALDRLFRLRFHRMVDGDGYARFRHWRVYGERGLMRRQLAIWLADDVLTLEFDAETLAQYRVRYEPDGHHLRDVAAPRLFRTGHRSFQLPLWELADAEWRKALRLPVSVRRPRRARTTQQLPLDLGASEEHSAG
jgi:putative transposase